MEPAKAEAPALQDPERVEKLEKRVAELEARVQQLETLLKTLTGQLGPAIDKATARAKEAMCANNLRQLWVLETTYIGPAKAMNKLAFDDPVGCCEPGHHPGGTITVLKKTGEVVTVGPDDPVYKRALETTTSQSAVLDKK
jgi:hypothetical protein